MACVIIGILMMLIFATLFLTALCDELKKEKPSNWTVSLCIFGILLELCVAMILVWHGI